MPTKCASMHYSVSSMYKFTPTPHQSRRNVEYPTAAAYSTSIHTLATLSYTSMARTHLHRPSQALDTFTITSGVKSGLGMYLQWNTQADGSSHRQLHTYIQYVHMYGHTYHCGVYRMGHNAPLCIQDGPQRTTVHTGWATTHHSAYRMGHNAPQCIQDGPQCTTVHTGWATTHHNAYRMGHNAPQCIQDGPQRTTVCAIPHSLSCTLLHMWLSLAHTTHVHTVHYQTPP